MKKTLHTYEAGFSLIEILVSVAIFSTVIIFGTVAILSIIDANQKAQSLNSVMTNLNTTLETMAREVRVGSGYHLVSPTELSFKPDVCDPALGAYCLTYSYDPATESIMRADARSSDAAATAVTAKEVHITKMNFSELSGGQPGIILRVSGYAETRQNTRSEFFVQTLMSQRLQ